MYTCGRMAATEGAVIFDYRPTPTAAVGVWVKSGSGHESQGQAGTTHLLEHLLLRRCGSRSPQAIAELIDTLGGDVNAYTTKEACAVVAHVPASRKQEALELILDAVFRPTFTEADVELEKKVVAAEFELYRDSPAETAAEKALLACWNHHPLARPILGVPQVVETLTCEDLVRFHRSRFGRQRAVLVAVGPWEEESLRSRLAVEPEALDGESSIPEAVFTPQLTVEERPGLEQVYVHLVFPGLPVVSPKLPVLEVLNQLLGGGNASRLFRTLRDELGLVYEVSSGLLATEKAGLLEVSLSAPVPRAERAWAALLEVLEEVASGGISQREVELAKQALISSMVLGTSSPDVLMEAHAGEFVSRGRRFSLSEAEREVAQVEREQVRTMAREVLSLSQLAGAVCGPPGGVVIPAQLARRVA